MKKSIFKSLLFISLLFGFQVVSVAQSPDYSDPTKSLKCLITTDFYIVHLTTYLVPKEVDGAKKRKKFEPFCQELPEHGTSFLAIDFIDRDLRQMPIGMKVVAEQEDPETGEMTEAEIIAQVPAQNYKNGVAQIQAEFPQPGHYALIATVGDDMFADKIRIPLRVGIGSALSWSTILPYALILLAILVAYGIYRFFVYRHGKNTTSIEE